jgi:hypothetical protein
MRRVLSFKVCVFVFLQPVQNGRDVAFTAILTDDLTVQGSVVVKYDRVLTNWGGAYHPSTGMFTAPYNGLYSISCTLMANLDNAVHVAITKNGGKLSIMYSHSTTFPQGSQTLQLKLRKGDKITIQNYNQKAAKLHDNFGGPYNIFSGFLIAKI